MALRQLGTANTTALQALNAWGENLSDADIAAIGQSVTDDSQIASILGGNSPAAGGILATGNTHSNTTLDTLVGTGGGPLASVSRGMLALGNGIPAGTFVADLLSASSVQLSQAATAAAAIRVAFISVSDIKPALQRNGTLMIPRRGILTVLPGDIVAVDNTGAVVIVPGASIGYSQSNWVLT